MSRFTPVVLLLAATIHLAADPKLREVASTTPAGRVELLVPDGKDVLALVAEKDGANLVSVTDGKVRRRFHHKVSGADCDASGKTLVLRTTEGEVLVYDLAAEREPKKLAGKADDARVSADGKLVALSFDGGKRVELRDAANDKPREIPVDEGEIRRLAVGTGGRVATCGFEAPRVEVYDSAQGKESGDLTPTGQPMSQLEFSQDGGKVLAVGIAGAVRLWDCASGKLDLTLDTLGEPHSVFSAGLSPDGTLMVTSTLKGDVAVWDVKGAEMLVRAKAYAAMQPATHIRFVGPTRFATCCNPGWKVILWEYEAGK